MIAAVGAVHHFDPFTGTGEEHGMLTDDIRRPDGLYPDFMGFSLADYAAAFEHEDVVKIPVHPFRCHLGKLQGRAARCIFFLVMVGFDNFDIVVVAQDGGGLFHQFEEDIHADRHIGGLDAGKFFRELPQFCQILGAETGSTDDHRPAVPGRHPGKLHRCLVEGEIDDHISAIDDRLDALADDHPVFFAAVELTRIPADTGIAFCLKRRGVLQMGMEVDHMRHALSHPAGCSGNYYLYHMNSLSFGPDRVLFVF
ncbi:MAG: hypothetical protein ACD_75C01103G0002 [uncultured bacterium]|nr:MAG: hypothetical protein ACD_75C01103G0002 [uncultured bacterium]